MGKMWDFECLLGEALAADREPEEECNQKILEQWEKKTMSRTIQESLSGKTFEENLKRKEYGLQQNIIEKEKRKRMLWSRPAVVLTAIAAVLLLSVTGNAAWKYLHGRQIAEKKEWRYAAEAFKDEDTIVVNESEEALGYRFTLLEIASGKHILEKMEKYPEFLKKDKSDLKDGKTYLVLAIEHMDGTNMPEAAQAEEELPLFISPFIQGLAPWIYNIACFDGGYTSCAADGIYYRMIECDDIEVFADREIYLGISDDGFHVTEAYHYDEESGKISRNETYPGINVLFRLPFEPSKANPEKAEEYLRKIEGEDGSNSERWETESFTDEDRRVDGKMENNTDLDTKKMKAVSGNQYWKKLLKKEGVLVYAANAGEPAEKMTAGMIRKCAKKDKESRQVLKEKNGVYCYQVDNKTAITFRAEDVFDKKTGWSRLVEWFEDGDIKIYILCYRDHKGEITGYLYKK